MSDDGTSESESEFSDGLEDYSRHPMGNLEQGVQAQAEAQQQQDDQLDLFDSEDEDSDLRSKRLPITFSELQQMEPTGKNFFYTEDRCFVAPTIDDPFGEPRIAPKDPITFLDYSCICGEQFLAVVCTPPPRRLIAPCCHKSGKPYVSVLSDSDAPLSMTYTLVMERNRWANPLSLKAGALPFLDQFSSYFVGTGSWGDLWWIFPRSADATAADMGDEDGFSTTRTAVKPAHGRIITTFMEQLFGSTPE